MSQTYPMPSEPVIRIVPGLPKFLPQAKPKPQPIRVRDSGPSDLPHTPDRPALSALRAAVNRTRGERHTPPAELRLLAMFAIGEADFNARPVRPVKRLSLVAFKYHGPVWEVQYVPFTKWLRPLDIESIKEQLGEDKLSQKEGETIAMLASGEWE